jgi:hypothetical protein
MPNYLFGFCEKMPNYLFGFCEIPVYAMSMFEQVMGER